MSPLTPRSQSSIETSLTHNSCRYVVKRTLYYKNMILSRTGGRDDGGIDLRGEWHIPIPPRPDPNSVLQSDTEPKPHRHHEHYCDHNDDYEPSEEPPSGYPRTKPIRVIIQCKGLTTVPAGPNLIRELAGAISSSMGGTIGILATMTPCTTGCRNAIRYSSKPMGYVCISEDGVIKQFVWNHRAELIVGTGLRVGVRNTEEVKGDPMGQEVVLTLDGEIVDGLLLSPVEVEIKLSKKQRKMQEQAAKKQLVKKTKEQYKEEGRRKKEAWNRRKQEMERYTD